VVLPGPPGKGGDQGAAGVNDPGPSADLIPGHPELSPLRRPDRWPAAHPELPGLTQQTPGGMNARRAVTVAALSSRRYP
jgi:hypothetical protein